MSNVEVETFSEEGLSLLRPEDRDDVLVAEQPVRAQADTQVVCWQTYQHGAYQVEIRLCAEEDGGFSVHVPTLAGVVSEGETKEEAERNVREALLAVFESYRRDQEPIPWESASVPRESGELSRWIVVHV